MTDSKSGSGRGRPPAGKAENGTAELVSAYPKLTISMKPDTRARLDAYSTLTRRPVWRIVDEALRSYLENIPADDKWAVEGMAKRMRAHYVAKSKKTVA